MTLLWLPSYSPNLNLIARVCKLVTAESLHGRYYPSFAPCQEAVGETSENTSPEDTQQRASLLTLHCQLCDNAASSSIVACEGDSVRCDGS